MKKPVNASSDSALIRKKAEAKLKKQFPEVSLDMSESDKLKLIHELQVHQVEMELQNEELKHVMLSEADALKLVHELKIRQVELDLQNEELLLAIAGAKDATELYDFAPTGYYSISKYGEILRLNLRGAEILGEEHSHINKSKFAFFVSDETKPVFANFLARIFYSKVKENCELILSGGKSPIQYVELTGIISKNEEQCMVKAVVITDRKKAEEALLLEHWRLESIIEGTHVGTWEWNVQTGETCFNEQWAHTIGYTLEELSPISISVWETHTHPDDIIISENLLKRHFKGELTFYDCDCRMKHKNGHWVWVHDRGRVTTRTKDGKPLIMFGTHTDITERKQAEELLAGSEIRYRRLFETAKDGILMLDALTGKILDVNPFLVELLGFSKEQFIDKSIWEIGVFKDIAANKDKFLELQQ